MATAKSEALKKVQTGKKGQYPGWRKMSGSARHNARQDKIMEHFHEHVEKQRTENPAWHKHHTEHILSKRYEGCAYCKRPNEK